MKKYFQISVFIIFTLLLSRGIVYSQINFWEPVTIPLSNLNLPTDARNVWSLEVASSGDLWAGTSEGVFLSTNNGDTWALKNNGLPILDVFGYKVTPNIYVLAINPVNGSIFAGSTQGLFRSTDYGENWTTVIDSDPERGTQVRTILATPSGEIYVGIMFTGVIPKGGICYSNDNGDTWVVKNNGLPPHPMFVESLALGPDGTLYASIMGFKGIYHSTDKGDNWLPLPNDIGTPIRLIFSADGSIFGVGGFVIKSTDRGVTWSQLNNIVADQIVYNPINEHLTVYHYINGFCISTDLGVTWHKTDGIPPYDVYNRVLAMAINSKTGMVFVGLTNIEDGATTVYRSAQNIARIITIDNIDILPESIDFGTIQLGSYKDTVLYVTNRGAIDIVVRYPKAIGNDALSFFNGLYMVSSQVGVILKPNETEVFYARFKPTTEGTKNAVLEIISDIGNLYVNVIGNGTSQTISIDEPEELPTDYSLSQNYPNPFNPTTKIEYSLIEDSKVRLTVYNSLGQEVLTLVNGNQVAGRYTVNVNVKNLPSGIYFYQLQSDNFNAVKKMMLIK